MCEGEEVWGNPTSTQVSPHTLAAPSLSRGRGSWGAGREWGARQAAGNLDARLHHGSDPAPVPPAHWKVISACGLIYILHTPCHAVAGAGSIGLEEAGIPMSPAMTAHKQPSGKSKGERDVPSASSAFVHSPPHVHSPHVIHIHISNNGQMPEVLSGVQGVVGKGDFYFIFIADSAGCYGWVRG